MEKPTVDLEEWFVSLQDVKLLYMSMWKRLLKWSWIGAVISYLYFGNSEVVYKAEATFKESAETSAHENFFKGLVANIISTNQPQTTALMKSNQVLRPLVEKLGMQLELKDNGWKIAKCLRRYRETWKAEKGLLVERPDSFIFSNVHYDGESFNFYLAFSSEKEFTVFDHKKKNELAKGKLGEPCSFKEREVASDMTFTLKKVPEELRSNKFYSFVANHWASITNDLKKNIKIKNDEDNKSILVITVTNPDRYLSAQVANGLMSEFQSYLKNDYERIARAQIAYLEGKQEQIFEKMDELFDEHIEYLSKNLEMNGYVGMDQEAHSFLAPHQQMNNQLLSIDVELKRLDEMDKEGKVISIAEDGPFSKHFNQITQKINDLKLQRDLIELSLTQDSEFTLQGRREDLKEVRDTRLSVEKAIQELDLGEKISSCDLGPGLKIWAEALTDPEEREDFAEYLENYARLLSMREKMLQERFFYGEEVPKEFEGIDLESVRSLFLQYNSKLDASMAKSRQFKELKKEIENPYFDLASLSLILHDALSEKIISEALSLEVQLKDEKHHSAKEGERWKQEIALRRKILMDHLDQLILVEELNADLMQEKMSALQILRLDCINQQVSALYEQMRDVTKERRKALLVEKEVLQKKMGEMRAVLSSFMPEKWRFERWLAIKTGMVSKMIEAVTEVVESKTMNMHLYHVESKPLDFALVPEEPEKSHLKWMSFLGACVFPFLIFSLAFMKRLLKGFPVTEEKLKAFRLHHLGKISAFCDGKVAEVPTGPDLEILRNIALFSEGAKVIGIIGGKGPDYSYALCENLARRHARSIVIRCDFLSKAHKEDQPGIFQIWKGEIGELPLREGKGFDYITSGGYTPFGTEIIQSSKFEELISSVKKNYDWVFLLFKSPLSSIESQAALKLCEKAVVTVCGEQIEELTPFVHWGYDGNCCRVTFITSV